MTTPEKINTALGYLRANKREILNTSWSSNRFIRFRVNREESSITEAILRTSTGKDFKNSNEDFDKFYNDLRKYLQRESKEDPKTIMKKFLSNENLLQGVEEYNVRILNKDKAEDITKLTFTFNDNTSRGFNMVNSLLENFKNNCNLFQYWANSTIPSKMRKLTFSNSRFEDKKLYDEITDDFKDLKIVMTKEKNPKKTQDLCGKIKREINERISIDVSNYFFKNLFSTESIHDYEVYLYDLYPYIFKTNFIIMIPWSNDITVEDMIIRDPSYPYIMLFKPFERDNFTYETGAFLASGRKVKYIIYPEKDKSLLASIYVNYNSNFSYLVKRHYKKFIEFKKENEETAADRYYEYINRESTKYRYTGQDKDISKFIKELKYYQTDIDDIISNMNLDA